MAGPGAVAYHVERSQTVGPVRCPVVVLDAPALDQRRRAALRRYAAWYGPCRRVIWKPARVAAAVEGLHRGERSDLAAPKVRVVIDASELGIEAVIYAILGLLVSVPLAGLLIAAVASGLGRRRFGFGSCGMGIVVAVAAPVVVVVRAAALHRKMSEKGGPPDRRNRERLRA